MRIVAVELVAFEILQAREYTLYQRKISIKQDGRLKKVIGCENCYGRMRKFGIVGRNTKTVGLFGDSDRAFQSKF